MYVHTTYVYNLRHNTRLTERIQTAVVQASTNTSLDQFSTPGHSDPVFFFHPKIPPCHASSGEQESEIYILSSVFLSHRPAPS